MASDLFCKVWNGDAKRAEVRLIFYQAAAKGGIIPVLQLDPPKGKGGSAGAPAELVIHLVDCLPGMVPP